MAEATLMKPWHDCPRCPKCKAPCGCLSPYNPSGWYGPKDATLFCPACGTGWYGTDAEIEQALAAEAWWNAFERSGLDEEQFAAAHAQGARSTQAELLMFLYGLADDGHPGSTFPFIAEIDNKPVTIATDAKTVVVVRADLGQGGNRVDEGVRALVVNHLSKEPVTWTPIALPALAKWCDGAAFGRVLGVPVDAKRIGRAIEKMPKVEKVQLGAVHLQARSGLDRHLVRARMVLVDAPGSWRVAVVQMEADAVAKDAPTFPEVCR